MHELTWFHWLLIGLFALDSVVKILMIDAPRKTLTRGDAVFCLIGNALLMLGVVAYA